jgi:hypothetical protein
MHEVAMAAFAAPLNETRSLEIRNKVSYLWRHETVLNNSGIRLSRARMAYSAARWSA